MSELIRRGIGGEIDRIAPQLRKQLSADADRWRRIQSTTDGH